MYAQHDSLGVIRGFKKTEFNCKAQKHLPKQLQCFPNTMAN